MTENDPLGLMFLTEEDVKSWIWIFKDQNSGSLESIEGYFLTFDLKYLLNC